jgi:regulator of protease activity HflC (stomatin/prohibitin superfamily)
MGGGAVTEVLLMIVVIVVLLASLVGASVRVLREYERAVVFRLGRLVGPRGPGLVLLIPGVDRMVRVSLRTVTLSIPPQDIITRDNVTARVDAVTYFRVVDPSSSVVDIEDAVKATSQIAQTTLRSVLGKADLDALLSERERLNEDLQQIIDEQTEPWGIKVTTVEIKDVGIPSTMQRAMARQAESERERRAKIIHAEGESQAAAKLAEAATVLSRAPAAIQLRYLQTLSEIGSEQNSTIVFPIPIDLLGPLLEGSAKAAPAEQAAAGGELPTDGELPEGARPAELPAGVAEVPEPVKGKRRRSSKNSAKQ